MGLRGISWQGGVEGDEDRKMTGLSQNMVATWASFSLPTVRE